MDDVKDRLPDNSNINTFYVGNGVSGVQIQQETRNSEQSQTNLGTDFDFAACAVVVSQIKEYSHLFESAFGVEAEEARVALGDAEAAVRKKEPRAIMEALRKLKSLAENVSGNLVAAGIIQLITSLSGVLV